MIINTISNRNCSISSIIYYFLTKDKQKELDARWLALFKIYYKHRAQISRINLWGVSDAGSWLNGWPVKGRTNYPLLFDRQYKEKPVINEIIKLYK